jgi:hypothetical protein
LDSNPSLSGVLGEFSEMLAMALRGGDDLHFLPVIGKLSATIEASDVGASESGGLRTAHGAANGYREAVAGMLASENSVVQFCQHGSPSTCGLVYPRTLFIWYLRDELGAEVV